MPTELYQIGEMVYSYEEICESYNELTATENATDYKPLDLYYMLLDLIS